MPPLQTVQLRHSYCSCVTPDAVVLDKEQVRRRQESDISTASLDLVDSITIKVQSSNKSITYSLGKVTNQCEEWFALISDAVF